MSNIDEIPTSEGVQPLTAREQFEAKYPHVVPIIRDEERLEAEDQSEYEADQRTRNGFRVREAELGHMLMVEQDSPQRSNKREERLLQQIEKLKADKAEHHRRREEDRRNKPGGMMQYIREFMSSPAVHRRYKPANTMDELLPGKTAPEMAAHYRAQYLPKLNERKAIIKAPQTAEEIRSDIASGVTKYAATLLKGVRFVEVDDKNRIRSRGLNLPRLAVPDGLGNITYVPDALGVMAALFAPEMIERLTALMLENHDESKALDAVERARRLAQVDAELREIEYKAEYFHRVARSQGANPGPRVSANVLAILDLLPA
ncbi:hypothetical protein V1290_003789 [Bradyrhizobium sp. AZCC 1578]|uniref:hypothetical protein n=1 Tax=Bradyrhizobium sp. AZCC 1578 TaxID=3117027 RepID=UPI002FF3C87C